MGGYGNGNEGFYPFGGNQPGKGPHRRIGKDMQQAELYPYIALHGEYQLCRFQAIATELKEMIVPANPGHFQYLSPDACDRLSRVVQRPDGDDLLYRHIIYSVDRVDPDGSFIATGDPGSLADEDAVLPPGMIGQQSSQRAKVLNFFGGYIYYRQLLFETTGLAYAAEFAIGQPLF